MQDNLNNFADNYVVRSMIKLISILILFSSLFLWNTSFSQQVYFNNRYDFYTSFEVGWSVMEVGSNYLVVAGVGDTASLYKKIGIMWIDSLGDEISKKSYGKIGFDYYPGTSGSLQQTSDGGFILGGSAYDGITAYAMLWRFDKNMDTLWTRTYGDTSYSQIGEQVKQTSDGGFIFIGEEYSTGNNNFLLIKTDSLGGMVWRKTFGGGADDVGLSIGLTSDNGYILGGFTRSFGAGGADMYVIKVDSLGNQQWDTTFGGALDDGAGKVMQTSDGGYLVVGAYGQYILSGSYNQRQQYVIKLDNQGVQEWERGFGPARLVTGLAPVHEQTDGSFIAAGQITNRAGTPNGNGFAECAILKFSTQGDSLWYRIHEYDTCSKNDDYIRDMRPTSDGGFIVAGFFSPRSAAPCNDTGGQDMWVMKLDSCGCAVPFCDLACSGDTTSVNELGNLNEDVGFIVYPNPFSGTATVKFNRQLAIANSQLYVYDITGRNVKTYLLSKNQTEATLQADEIGMGMFFVQVETKEGISATRKIIISE